MAVDKKLVELMEDDAQRMKKAKLVEKYVKAGYSEQDIDDSYRDLIEGLLDDDF